MDLEQQPHSVPAAFGSSSTPPGVNNAAFHCSSVDDSTLISKTPTPTTPPSASLTSLNRKLSASPSSLIKPASSPRGVKRKSSFTTPPAALSSSSSSKNASSASQESNSCSNPPPNKSSFVKQPSRDTKQPSSESATVDYQQSSQMIRYSSSSASPISNLSRSSTSAASGTSTSTGIGVGPSSSTTPPVVRMFSTSMLNRAHSFLSRGAYPSLSAFHANECQTVKFVTPLEDDVVKSEVKLEAQHKFCSLLGPQADKDMVPSANTAIANMKALTDSIPTPSSWMNQHPPPQPPPHHMSQHPHPHMDPHQQQQPQTTPPLNMGNASNSSAVSASSSNIKQEGGDLSRNGANCGSPAQTSTSQSSSQSQSNGGSNLSQELLSKRAIKTEYLKTLKKSLLDDEMHMNNECKQPPPPQSMQAMQLPYSAQHRLIQQQQQQQLMGGPPMMGPGPGAIPPGGGNQTANAVAMAAASRAAAMRQQDFLRQQQQQQQHNHANCVQGMCMHQMAPSREMQHPAAAAMAARQMMVMGQHHPSAPGALPPGPQNAYLAGSGPMGVMHNSASASAPGMRMNPPTMHGASSGQQQQMMKCRPGCNISHAHNIMGPGPPPPGAQTSPGAAMFMPPPHMQGAMYAQNPRTGAPMMVGPNGMDPALMPAGPPGSQGMHGGFSGMPPGGGPMRMIAPQQSNGASPLRSQMMPPYMHSVPPGAAQMGPPPQDANSNPQYHVNGPPSSMSAFPPPANQRVPGAPNVSMPTPMPSQQTGGNNPMINVIMTIGSSGGQASMAATPTSQQAMQPSAVSNATMGNYPMQTPMMMNNGAGMSVKSEPHNMQGGGGVSMHGFGPGGHPGNAMYGNANGNMSQDNPNVAFNSQGAYQHPNNIAAPSDAASVPDYYSMNPSQMHGSSGSMELPGMANHPQHGSQNAFGNMDEIPNQNLMNVPNDQRHISVNVDKNMFMVQSNLNGAQFNVQGSALPQGPNLRTNVAVNMQVQSNRYPSNPAAPQNTGGTPSNMTPPSQIAPSGTNGGSFKYPSMPQQSHYDPAGQGLMQQSAPSQMWPQNFVETSSSAAMQHHQQMQQHRAMAHSFDMYSNLSEFKPISDTPKGTVEYLPDGKTREKCKDHVDYSSNIATSNAQSMDMMGHSQSMIPSQPSAQLFNPNTFNDFHFPSM